MAQTVRYAPSLKKGIPKNIDDIPEMQLLKVDMNDIDKALHDLNHEKAHFLIVRLCLIYKELQDERKELMISLIKFTRAKKRSEGHSAMGKLDQTSKLCKQLSDLLDEYKQHYPQENVVYERYNEEDY